MAKYIDPKTKKKDAMLSGEVLGSAAIGFSLPFALGRKLGKIPRKPKK